MFLKLNHQKLDIYKISSQFVFECYKLTRKLPVEEKFGMFVQIRRAALSVHLNIAEGCSRKSPNERNRYFEIARRSVIEIDSAIGISFKLEYVKLSDLKPLGESIVSTFKLITGMIK